MGQRTGTDRRAASRLLAAAALATALSGCAGGSKAADPQPAPAWSATRQTYAPGEVMLVVQGTHELTLARDEYAATIGGAAATGTLVDRRTIGLLVPALPEGAHSARVETEHGAAVIAFDVVHRAAIADPAAVVSDRLAVVRARIDALVAAAGATPSPARAAALAALEDAYADATAAAAAATPDEIAAAAAFFDANAAALDVDPLAAEPAAKLSSGGARSAPTPAAGTCLALYPDSREDAASCISARLDRRLLAMAVTSWAAVGGLHPLVRLAGVVSVGVQIVAMVDWLSLELNVGFVQCLDLLVKGPAASSKLGGRVEAAATAAAPLTVVAGETLSLELESYYRKPDRADDSAPPQFTLLRSIVDGLLRFDRLWARADGLLGGRLGTNPHAPAGAVDAEPAAVQPRFVTLTAAPHPAVTLEVTATSTGFTLAASSTSDQPETVTVVARYEGPGLARSETSFEVVVSPGGCIGQYLITPSPCYSRIGDPPFPLGMSLLLTVPAGADGWVHGVWTGGPGDTIDAGDFPYDAATCTVGPVDDPAPGICGVTRIFTAQLTPTGVSSCTLQLTVLTSDDAGQDVCSCVSDGPCSATVSPL